MMIRNRIKMLRKEAGYNQKELGKLLEVGQTTISAWEIGRNEPPTEYSHKMAKLFGCSIGYLMGYEEESEHRGLSDKEWAEFISQKRQKKEDQENMTQEEDGEDAEIQHMAEDDANMSQIEKWEESGRATYLEAIEINDIMEDLTASQRKALLDMVKSAKSAFGQ